MAQRTLVELTDDIDGSKAEETLTFGLDGTTYEIDLNKTHADELREVLAPYVSVGRKVIGSVGHSRRGAAASAPRPSAGAEVDPKAVRAWAAENGVEVSPRGRIKADIVEKYRAASG